MNSSKEILRSVALLVAGLVAMLAASVVLGLHVERSIGREPGVFLHATLPCAHRAGS
jgi:hypothetical protein